VKNERLIVHDGARRALCMTMKDQP
jgi:hypothetical protein